MIHRCNKPCGNKTASGYCATTICINPQFSNIGTVHYGQGVQKRIITNADRIRAMTDEELATKLYLSTCIHVFDSEVKCKDNGCKKCWLDWLSQEATDG